MPTQPVIPEHELPHWMKQARRGNDWGFLLVIGFCLLIAWSFIINADLPRTNDSIHYAFRVADTTEALREGRLYPRWSPYASGGLGAPIPHYYPPAAPYLTALIEILFTNSTVAAMRVVHIGALVLSGVMIYALVTARVNALAGFIAALLYVYSPYISLTAPHVLGTLPEVLALALLPMLLWSVSRLLLRNQALDFLYVVLITAALLLTSPRHSVMGLLLSSVLIVVHLSEYGGWRRVWTSSMAFLLGSGLAAFYWLPALLEHNLVQWQPSSNLLLPYQLSWSDFFSQTQQLDRGMLKHYPQFNLGWMLLLFVATSILVLVVFRRGNRFQIIFLILGIIITVFAIVIAPSATWLLGIIVLCLAIGASSVADFIVGLHRLVGYGAVVIGVSLIFGLSLPIWFSQSSQSVITGVSPSDQIQYEAQANAIATLPDKALLPTNLTGENIALRVLAAGLPLSNVSRFSPSDRTGGQITLTEQGTHQGRYVVITTAPMTPLFQQTYFPGWLALLDNMPIPLHFDPDTGLTRVEIPAILNGELIITLGTTPIRTSAWVLSSLMLLGIMIVVWRRWQMLSPTLDESSLLGAGYVRLLTCLLLMGLAGRTVPQVVNFISPIQQLPNYRLSASTVTTTNNPTSSHLALRGYQVQRKSFAGKDTISVTLFWEAEREASDFYQVALRLRNTDDDTIWYETPRRTPGWYPTSLWQPTLYIEDSYQLPLPTSLSPGAYEIEVIMWRCNNGCTETVDFFTPSNRLLGSVRAIPIPAVIK